MSHTTQREEPSSTHTQQEASLENSPHSKTREAAHDILSLMTELSNSFDISGNMPGQYTIRLDSNNKLVEHAHLKVSTVLRKY